MLYRQFAMTLSLLLSVSVAGTAQGSQGGLLMETRWACAGRSKVKVTYELMKKAAKWDAVGHR